MHHLRLVQELARLMNLVLIILVDSKWTITFQIFSWDGSEHLGWCLSDKSQRDARDIVPAAVVWNILCCYGSDCNDGNSSCANLLACQMRKDCLALNCVSGDLYAPDRLVTWCRIWYIGLDQGHSLLNLTVATVRSQFASLPGLSLKVTIYEYHTCCLVQFVLCTVFLGSVLTVSMSDALILRMDMKSDLLDVLRMAICSCREYRERQAIRLTEASTIVRNRLETQRAFANGPC